MKKLLDRMLSGKRTNQCRKPLFWENFKGLAENGKCVIIVSHSPDIARMCDVQYDLKRAK